MKKLIYLFFVSIFSISAMSSSWVENLGSIQESAEAKKSYIAGMLFGKSYGSYSLDNLSSATNTTKFYEQNRYKNFWILEDFTLNKNIFDMIWVIRQKSNTPKKQKRYHLKQVNQILQDIKSDKLIKDKDRNLAVCKLDILITDAFFAIASDIYQGEIDFKKFKKILRKRHQKDSINYVWDMDKTMDYVPLLYKLTKENDILNGLDNLEPKSELLTRLKQGLRFYEDIKEKGGWQKIPKGKTLKRGIKSKRVSLLRQRLAITKDLKSSDLNGTLFDDVLEDAVKHFQERNGITPTGKVAKETLKSLNIPVEERIKTIKLNIQRAKFEKDSFEYDHVWINIPEFKMKFIKNSQTLFEMRTVVGSIKNPTPIFDANMSYLVLNPYWNVPQSIAKKEILAKIQENPEYLLVKNYKVYKSWKSDRQEIHPYDVDWTLYDHKDDKKLPFNFSKQPGVNNPLGAMKFMFPNKYAVYMHDTPEKNLFKKSKRAFSHGCIRLHKPKELLKYLSENYLTTSYNKLKDILKQGKNTHVNLKREIPVFIRYYTSWVDDYGVVNFRNDIYNYDKIQKKLLFSDLDK